MARRCFMWCCRKIRSRYEMRPKCPALSRDVQAAVVILYNQQKCKKNTESTKPCGVLLAGLSLCRERRRRSCQGNPRYRAGIPAALHWSRPVPSTVTYTSRCTQRRCGPLPAVATAAHGRKQAGSFFVPIHSARSV